MSQDPLGAGASDINLYGYVRSDPLSYVDPTGLTCWGPQTDCSTLPPKEAWKLPPSEWPAYRHDLFFDWLNRHLGYHWWDPSQSFWHIPGYLVLCFLDVHNGYQ